MSSSQDRVWFITGSSSGFGRMLAEQVLEAGERVVATARNPASVVDLEKKYPGRARAFRLDVTNGKEVNSAVSLGLETFGRIDVLVNNAGYGLVAAQEEASEEEIRQQIETNIFGVIRVTRAVLPQMRRQRSGRIINLSSIAGLIGTPGLGFYNASKFAVEGLSEALAHEVAPFGIYVTAIEPGPFRTDFAGRSAGFSAREMPEYSETAGKTRSMLRSISGTQKGDPARAAEAIRKVVDSPKPPQHLILGEIALTRFRGKIRQMEKETAEWESITLGADFPDNGGMQGSK